jgi:quinol---cytochrome c reductase iron-sulfur subunit, bacillus type
MTDNFGIPVKSEPFPVFQPKTSRRGFLKLIVGVLSALVVAAMAIPLIATLIGPSFRLKKPRWAKVGDITALAINQPVNLKFPFKTEDAYLRETTLHDVWVVKHSSSEVTVFSPICPHLGCHYDWHAEGSEFICPCHGSVYSMTGKVLGGPAPRPLDTLPWKLEGNVLTVEWETFKVGVPQKIRT